MRLTPLLFVLLGPGLAHAAEVCVDSSGTVTDAIGYYDDVDGDGYGAGGFHVTCTPDADDVPINGDCRRTDPSVYPGQTETCNGQDDNCDGLVDDNDPLVVADGWYRDGDLDGYGDDGDGIASCRRPDGYVRRSGDCADDDDAIHPGATEYCDGIDNDCSGSVDRGVAYLDWYADADGDGFGDPADTIVDCAQPSGYLLDAGDCDDGDAAISPAAREKCDNGADDDCDAHVDNCHTTIDAADVAIEGPIHDAWTGWTLGVADVDGDGTDDIITSSPGRYETVDVAFGPRTGTSSVADDGPTIWGGGRNWFGEGLTAGDSDLDGYGDVLTGDTYINQAYLFRGPITADRGIDDADAVFGVDRNLWYLGRELDIARDFDGDGDAEIVLGAPYDHYKGAIYVVPATVSGSIDPWTDCSYRFVGSTESFLLGWESSDIGDMDGDGTTEIAIGARNGIYLVPGGLPHGWYDPGDVAFATVPVTGYPQNWFGDWENIVGVDYDLDGSGDLVVTDPDYTAAGMTDFGAAFGFQGPLSGDLATADADVAWLGGEISYRMAAGDLNGDTIPDLVLGGVRQVYVSIGPASGVIDADTLWSIPAERAALGLLGDWSGDDLPELAVGSSSADTERGTNSGGVFIFSSEQFY